MISYLVWQDYLILAAFLVISLGIGVYHSLTGGRQKTTEEFIMANRNLKVIPTTISLLVSFQSAISLLGLSAEMYDYGTQLLILIPFTLFFVIAITERVIVPWLYPLQLVSTYEYLERRYKSKSVRMLGASLGLISGILYMGVCLYAPSSALESATGLPLTVSIPVMSFVAVAYTSLGGMRAVIWTDVFQFGIMVGGMLAIIIKGLIMVGGFSNVIQLAAEEGRLQFVNISPDPRERHTVWGLVVGLTIGWTSVYGFSQASVQRYSAVDQLYKARITVLLNLPPMLIMNVIACFMGLIILAYYSTIRCDPVASESISSSNQLLPFFVVNIFADSPGFGGLFLSTLYGGSLSSISSCLSGGAANVWEDILDWKLSKLPESRKALINRFLVVVLGVLATGVAFMSGTIPGPITQVTASLTSSVAGPLMGIFLIGGITRLVNWKGALFGGLLGFVCSAWLAIGSKVITLKYPTFPPLSTDGCQVDNITSNDHLEYPATRHMDYLTTRENAGLEEEDYIGIENFYAISYCWYVTFGVLITATAAIIISLLTRDKELEQFDDALLMRFRNIFSFSCRDEVKTEGRHDDKLSLETESKIMTIAQKEFLAKVDNIYLTKDQNGHLKSSQGDFSV